MDGAWRFDARPLVAALQVEWYTAGLWYLFWVSSLCRRFRLLLIVGI
jgi:hypothetical protein